MQEPELMRLSIPRGWAVGDNKFYDVAPIKDEEGGSNFILNSLRGFTEDILWLFEWRLEQDAAGNSQLAIPQTNFYTIDLGWYPDADFTGGYCARLYWQGEERIEADTFSSRDRNEIRDRIEHWMEDIMTNYAEAHSRFA